MKKILTSKQFVLFMGIFIVILSVGVYLKHLNAIRFEIENTFQSRNALLKKFIALHRDQVTVMQNLIVERYQESDSMDEKNIRVDAYPNLNVWQFSSSALPKNVAVTGDGSVPLTKELLHEINAASGMEAQSKTALIAGSDVVWAYYQSANRFIYLSPYTSVHKFHFTPKLYQEGYWLQAIPKANPKRRMIISGPYKDQAGKGWILTMASPVYVDNTFLGIVALDIHINTLQKLANVGVATGETMMISENNHCFVNQHEFKPGMHLCPPLSKNLVEWKKDTNGDLWLSHPVLEDEMWLVHHVSKKQLYGEAAFRSLPSWFILLMFSLLGVVALKLEKSNIEITRLMQIDPLTKALNRRGFYEKIEAILAIAKRKKLKSIVLMMDIDFFKKVNDTYGHAVGDSVLEQVGHYLGNACRPFDLFCRWGGEEFVLLLTLDPQDDAFEIAERLRQEAQKTRIQPGGQQITLSGGLVLVKEGESIEDAIKRADTLLYDAKTTGRDHIELDDQCS